MARNLLRVWPVALTALVMLPLLGSGFILSYDMVFVPDQAWRPDYAGLGAGVPRAVPSDALVSWLSTVLPGSLLQKLVLVAILLLAGYGVLRLLREASVAARFAAVAAFMWNPYVAERLTLGQWVVLLGYATLPWVLGAALAARRGSTRACGSLVIAFAVAATSASGALMAAGVGLPVLLWRRTEATGRQRWAVVAGLVCVNLPWLVAGALHRSDLATNRAAVEAFAASGEGRLPVVATVLGLGGVWNTDVVPGSREGWVAVVWLVVFLAVVAAGFGPARRALGRPVMEALLFVAALSFVVSLAGVLDDGVLARLSGDVPGVALLRDGTRYLGGLAVVEAVLFGFGVQRIACAPRDKAVRLVLAAGLTLAPLAAMPDLAWGVGGRLDTASYPNTWAEARSALVAADPGGRVLVLPASAYRAYGWNGGTPGLDPASRYFPGAMLASDALTVDGVEVQPNDPTTQAAVDAFAAGDARSLRELGVGAVIVDADVAELRAAAPAAGGRAVFDSDEIAVYTLAAPDAVHSEASDVSWVVAAWSLAGLAIVLAVSARRRSRVPHASGTQIG